MTSGGVDWQREKWQSGFGSKFIRQGEKNAVKAYFYVDILGLGEDKQDESIPFIFQEANFYVNKSIDKLDVMKPCAEVIFNKGVAYSKLIDAYRLETVIYILKEVRKKSYSSEKELEENGNLSQEGIQMVAKQKECDKEYNQKMQTILGSEEIKNVLEKELKWID